MSNLATVEPLVQTQLEDKTVLSGEYRWTVDALCRAIDANVFENPERLELIHGRIIENMSISPLHADAADYFAECLRAALSPRFKVREEKPLHIAFDGEPVPDIIVMPGGNRRYQQQHPLPEDVVLVVEVSVSSVEYDLGEKSLLYAAAEIVDYWVVLPEQKQIVMHRDPSPSGYGSVTILAIGETLSLLAAQDVTFSVGELLGVPSEVTG